MTLALTVKQNRLSIDPMTESKEFTRVGFWHSEREPDLPVPQPADEPWDGQSEFLTKLESVEFELTPIRYRGFSTCRICGCRNGTTEFVLKNQDGVGGWRWPSGLYHYVATHNVRPDSDEFISFIQDHRS